jgi:hypothetical protein
MPIDAHPKRRGPTSAEVVAEQRRQAEALKEQKQRHDASTRVHSRAPSANVPARVTPAVTGNECRRHPHAASTLS